MKLFSVLVDLHGDQCFTESRTLLLVLRLMFVLSWLDYTATQFMQDIQCNYQYQYYYYYYYY